MNNRKPRLTAHAPVLLVQDVLAAEKYYREHLGFTCVGFFNEPPTFCILKRDELSLMLSQVPDGQTVVPHWQIVPSMSDVYFWVDDVEALFEEYQAAGAHIDFELCNQPYGCREFGIQDLDKHDITFGQILDSD